jgi:tetratricopeptide (TPR) repeat protein
MPSERFRSILKAVAISLVLLVPLGCATTIPVNMIQPAEFHEASLTRTVAVLPFAGSGGVEFASEVEGLLTSIDINGRPYFTLVDRASIDKVISEMKLSQSALANQGTAAKLGKLIGAQGIYTGTVTANTTRDSRYSAQRSECAQHQMKRDDKGNLYEGNCIRWRNYNVRCTKRQATFAVTPKLIDVATGKIIYSKNLSGAADSSGCEDGTPPATEQELLDKSRQTVKNSIRRDVAPYYITVMLNLKDGSENTSPAAMEKLTAGISYADKQRMDAACEQWGEARQLAPNSPSILYNLGICAEIVADVDSAMKLYRQADKLIGKPDEDITQALSRVAKALSDQKKLKVQMLVP